MAGWTVLILSLGLYLALGGADFGAGIWGAILAARGSDEDRSLLYGAIGPVWEVNHVWLIFSLILLFGTLPLAFAGIFQALWVPLALALAGIFFRGMAYFLRSSPGSPSQRKAWGGVFALSSVGAAFFLGAGGGALAEGRLALRPSGVFQGSFLLDWISALSLFAGIFTVSLCAFLASCYLRRECDARGLAAPLRRRWRARALASGSLCGALAIAGLVLARYTAPEFLGGLEQHGSGPGLAALACLGAALFSLVRDWTSVAVIFAAGSAAGLVGAWGLQVLPSLPASQVPQPVLKALLGSVFIGLLLLAPSLLFLFKVFKGPAAD